MPASTQRRGVSQLAGHDADCTDYTASTKSRKLLVKSIRAVAAINFLP